MKLNILIVLISYLIINIKCDIKLSKQHNVEFSPIVETEISFSNKFICDSPSKWVKIYSTGVCRAPVTCDGITVANDDISFTAVVRKGHHEQAFPVAITQYSGLSTYNNGNRDFQESGVLSGDVCPGDTFWGMSIFRADNLKACTSFDGLSTARAIYRVWKITGKCNSTCEVFDNALGNSTYALSPPVNRWGLGGRKREIVNTDVNREAGDQIED